jgi:hypothetical protein
MQSHSCGVQGQAAYEELKVHTVHRGRNWRGDRRKKFYAYLFETYYYGGKNVGAGMANRDYILSATVYWDFWGWVSLAYLRVFALRSEEVHNVECRYLWHNQCSLTHNLFYAFIVYSLWRRVSTIIRSSSGHLIQFRIFSTIGNGVFTLKYIQLELLAKTFIFLISLIHVSRQHDTTDGTESSTVANTNPQ